METESTENWPLRVKKVILHQSEKRRNSEYRELAIQARKVIFTVQERFGHNFFCFVFSVQGRSYCRAEKFTLQKTKIFVLSVK